MTDTASDDSKTNFWNYQLSVPLLSLYVQVTYFISRIQAGHSVAENEWEDEQSWRRL